MTNKEAIEVLKNDIETCTIQQKQACDVAVIALEQTRWIPVSEKKSEPFTEVLVNITCKGKFEGIGIGMYCPDVGYIDDWDTQIDWAEGPIDWYHVTAWMPLPKPYKEESEENSNEN